MHCPNGNCPHLAGRGSPAELNGQVCPYCGSVTVQEPAPMPGASATDMETIAAFRDAHEAHLARGALEAEGIPAQIWGEHSVHYSDAGAICLGVPADQAGRAREILLTDNTRLIEDGPDLERHAIGVPVCPNCGSASVQEAAGTGILAIFGEIASAMLGRPWACLTCGGRWRGERW